MKTSHAQRMRYEIKEALTITIGDGETLDTKLASIEAEAEVAARVWYVTTHKIVLGENDSVYSFVSDITGLGLIVRVSGASVPERVYLAFPLTVGGDGELVLGDPYPVKMVTSYVRLEERSSAKTHIDGMLKEYESATEPRRLEIADALSIHLKSRAFDTANETDRAFLNRAQRVLPSQVAALISAATRA